MNQAAPAWYFPSVRDLWRQHLDVIENGAAPEIGFRGAITRATVVFIDMGGFTGRANEHASDPAVAGFLGHHFASFIENWSLALKSDVRGVYLDKIVGDAVMLVIPGDGPSSISLGLKLARATLMGPGIYDPHIGLHAGDICLCDVGLAAKINRTAAFEQITVMGAVVNLAARLASVADPGTVATIAEPIEDGGLTPVAQLDTLAANLLSVGSVVRKGLKGFRPGDVGVRMLSGSSVMRRDAIDVAEMLRRVAEMGRRLPRLRTES